MRIALMPLACALLALGPGCITPPPATSPARAAVARIPSVDYTLVWADEFDRGSAPDPANWTF